MIQDLVADRGAHAGREIDRLRVVAIDHPRPDEVMLPLGERADQRDRLARLGQRQQVAVVLQHDDRFARRLARQRAARGQQRARCVSRFSSMRRKGSSNRPSIALTASTRRTD